MIRALLRLTSQISLLWLITCLSYPSAHAQTKEIDSLSHFIETHIQEDDSLATVLARLSYLHNSFDPDKGIRLGERGLEISKRIDFSEGISRSFNSLGVNYYAKEEYVKAIDAYNEAIRYKEIIGDKRGAMMTQVNLAIILVERRRVNEALKYYEEARAYFEEAGDDNVVGVVLVNMAQAHRRLRADSEALRLYLLALEYAEKSGNQAALATTLTNISVLYIALGEYDQSLTMRKRSLKITQETNNRRLEAQVRVGLGLVFQRLHQNDSARYYFQSAYEMADEIGLRSRKASALQNLGTLAKEEGDYQAALDYYQQALTLREMSSSRRTLPFLYRSMGEAHLNLRQKQTGLENLLKSLFIGQELGAITSIAEGAEALTDYYESEGNFERAFYYAKMAREANETIDSRQDIPELAKLVTRYQNEKENQSLLLRQAEEEAALYKKLDAERMVRNLTIAGFVGVLILALIYYRFYKSKKRAHALLEEQNRVISEQKNALGLQAEKLLMVNSQMEMLSEFRTGLTQMIAHDMKNPLNAIIGLSDGQPTARNVKKIAESGYQMLNLVTNMLEVEKLEETGIKPEKKQVFIDELIQKAKNQVEILLQAKSIFFQSLVPKQIGLIADEGIIVRVLVNLLTNAIKYSENGGVVKVTHEIVPDGFLRISIIDEGPGIEPDRLPHIFNKFWQSDQKQSGLAVSTGLGLTFCKLALESHGGRIWADSEQGKGTSFTFELSISREACADYIHLSHGEIQPREYLIEPDEFSVLDKFAGQLVKLKVHEVGAITRIFRKMEEKNVTSRWKIDLQGAVYDGDQTKYNQLLKALYEDQE
ncbi:MAG: sensor histidine kinase [Roseivirga sp.]|nr:sensor histidine kinase [Roseivirga sp.]